MERRSAKRTAPRRRYTVDAFEGVDELEGIRSDDDPLNDQLAEHSSEGGFEDNNDQSSDEDEMSGVGEPLVEDVSDRGSNAGEHDLDDSISIAEEPSDLRFSKPGGINGTNGRPKRRMKNVQGDGPKTYTRGAYDRIGVKTSNTLRRLCFYGPAEADNEPVLRARRKWFYEPTLPSKVADPEGFGGMHRSFFLGEDMRVRQVEEYSGWWLDDGGRDLFLSKQLFSGLSEERAAEYALPGQNHDLPCAMGPFQSQHLFNLGVGQAVSLRNAWKQQNGRHTNGFVLNLGARFNCLDWAPNQDGADQHLAVSVLPPRVNDHAPFEAPKAPAFTPQPQYKSNIQVWAFQVDGFGSVDSETPPQLKLTICSEWGDAKCLKWCPVSSEEDQSAGSKRLGLLAGIWFDGAIRILDLSVPKDGSDVCHSIVEKAAFESHPPDTLYTCLAWISSSRIAAGCANGCIAIWGLPKSLRSTSTNARPIIYSSISTSYILAMDTCYPSRPDMLLTISMNGYIGMTDLSQFGTSPSSPSNTVYSSRIRLSHPPLLWHEFSQTVLHVEDSYIMKGSPVRRLFTNIGLGRAKSNATSLAVSPCHPFVLVGSADGEVFATNPLRRVTESKVDIWQQTWFAHEWRRPPDEELSRQLDPTDQPSASHGVEQISSAPDKGANVLIVEENGISRMLDGFKAERISLAVDGRTAQRYNQLDGTHFATIFEEKSAITALAWNPNPHVGGWAAAGMGDGLLRVENIAT